MPGTGAARAAFGFRFHFRLSGSRSVARGVTDPGIGCTDWLALLRGIVDICDANLPHSVIEPVGENIVFDHEMLNLSARLIREGVVAPDLRIGSELSDERYDSL